ncbi:MAG TPA: TonB-dependent receptor [Terracidiphilus sp.]|nr:TonB-dependent receptor [Terracidiphilus sp.]
MIHLLSRRAAQLCLLVCVTILFISSGSAFAQQTVGGILGSVADSSGAVVPATQVKLVSTETGLTRTVVAKANGEYAFTDLAAGTYDLTFTHDGFDSGEYAGVLVQVGRVTTLNAQLKVGSVATAVEVTANPLLNTVDTTNGNVLEAEQIEATPLATGSFTQLATLAPGITADLLSGTGTNDGLGNQNLFANGQRSTSNTFTINSVNANNLFNGNSSSNVAASRAVLNTGESFQSNGTIATSTSIYDAIGQALPSPPQQTIQELQVNTSGFDASQGATAGAHLDVATKSGTNQYHGSAYGLIESSNLDANPFFNSQAGLPTPDLHRYWVGTELGGPIIKQKLFFYGSYQFTRDRDQLRSLTRYHVPTDLTDDRSVTALQTIATNDAKLPANTPLDPVAVALLSAKLGSQYLILSPNDPGNPNGNVEFNGPSSSFDAAQANGNLDYHVSDNDVIASKYYYQRAPTTAPFSSSPLLGFGQTFQSGSQVYSLTNNHIFSPRLSWDQKIGILRETATSFTGQPFGPSNIGGSGASINLFGSPLFPGISVSSFDGNRNTLNIGPSSNFSNTGFAQNTIEATSNVTWLVHNHTLTFGGNYDFTQLNILNRATQAASLQFTSLGNFLSGGPVRTGAGHTEFFQGASNRYYRAPQVGAYVQDHWRVTSKLNVTAGIRYDNDGGLSEKYGNLVNFDPTKYSYDAPTDTITSAGLIVAGNNKLYHTPGASNSTLKNGQFGVAPRIGIAYQVRPDLVVRTGFGLYYDRGEYFTEFSPSAGGGFNGPFGVTLQPPFVQPVLATSTGTLDNPFGTTLPTINTNPATFVANLPNQGALINDAEPYLFGAYGLNNKLPLTENWSLDLQWQARHDLAVTVGYSGNHSQHQTIPVPFNQPQIATPAAPLYATGKYPQTYSYGFQAEFSQEQTVNGKQELVSYPLLSEPYNTNTGGNTDLRTPYIGYSPNSVSWNTVGIANYDALLATLHKTVSHGLDAYVSYTYAHSLDDSSGFGLFYNGNNPQNLRSGYASSDFDQTHTIAISFDYRLPKLKANFAAAKVLANGWELQGYSILQSGQPYNVYDFSGTIGSIYFSSNDFLTNPVLPLAPGVSAKKALTGHSGAFGANDAAFNPASFTYPLLTPGGPEGVPPCGPTTLPGTNFCDAYESGFSNGQRNIFRSAFQKSANIAIVKETKVYERASLRLSMELINITNTPSFDAPGNSFDGDPNFAPYGNGPSPASDGFVPLGPGTPESAFSDNGVGVVSNPIGSARILQFTGILRF